MLDPLQPEWHYMAGMTERHGTRYPLSALFEYGAGSTPQRPAISDGRSSHTFLQLELGARRVAAALREAGIGRGDRVAILCEQRALLPMLAAAIWKLGAIYCPLDSADNTARNSRTLTALRPAILLGPDHALWNHLGAHCIGFAALEQCAADSNAASLETSLEVDEQAPAYILFASGSTGTPKGVMVSHASLLDYFFNYNQVLKLTAESRVLSFTPFHLAVSIEDTLLPLSLGAHVVQYRGILVAQRVQSILEREAITHMIAGEAALSLISRSEAHITRERLPQLQMVMTGAEACDPDVIDLWKTRLPQTRVIEAYAPTEATLVCLTHTIETAAPLRRSGYPIGRPLPGVSLKIVRDAEEIHEPGISGELWVGGSQIMLGFWDDAPATASVIREFDGQRFYRTGDACQYDPQGNVLLLGRMDQDVKIAARDIDLGEIREAALSHPAVARAAIGLVQSDGRPQIAMVLISAADACMLDGVGEHLLRQLPAYMQPQVLAHVATPRLSSTGKTAERQLLELLSAACSQHAAARFTLTDAGVFAPLGTGTTARGYLDQDRGC